MVSLRHRHAFNPYPRCADFETARLGYGGFDYGIGHFHCIFRRPAVESHLCRHRRLCCRIAAFVELRDARLSENPRSDAV